MAHTTDRPDGEEFTPGTAVEVHNQFTRQWTAGFEVATAGPDGYRLRRTSDASVLPAVFPIAVVRCRETAGSREPTGQRGRPQ